MTKRLVWCALGGAVSALLVWSLASAEEWTFVARLDQIEIGQTRAPSLVMCNELRDWVYVGWYRLLTITGEAKGAGVGPLELTPCTEATSDPVAVGESFRDIVHDSEGGRMPSREEFDRRGPIHTTPDGMIQYRIEGESDGQTKAEKDHQGEGDEKRRPQVDPWVPKRAGEAEAQEGHAHRAVEVRPLSKWLFGIFNPAGQLIGAAINATADECEAQLTEDRQTHPGYRFSRCIEIMAERGTP